LPLCSTRSESSRPDRHFPPFRLQHHVCLPTSEDPWFVHQPAGQVVVVSLAVVCNRLVNSRKAISRLYSGGEDCTVRFEAELGVIKKTFVGHGWNKNQRCHPYVMARPRKRVEQRMSARSLVRHWPDVCKPSCSLAFQGWLAVRRRRQQQPRSYHHRTIGLCSSNSGYACMHTAAVAAAAKRPTTHQPTPTS
jgi:hypothetical protein